MKCRFCPRVPKETVEDHVENEINPEQNQNYPEETQEHHEICRSQKERTRYVKMARHSKILDENVDKTVKFTSKTKK